MYGMYYWRPPLYNLMIIPVAQLIGWDHMLVAARIVALTATISSALLLAWFVRRLFGDKTFAAFTALIYLTLGDVLFYRGWLCYSEPVFGLFVLMSIVFGWLALAENRYTYLAVAVLAVSAAFLCKALTAYVFYVIAMIVVAYRLRRWAFLYSWKSLLLNGLALTFPLFWYRMVSAGGCSVARHARGHYQQTYSNKRRQVSQTRACLRPANAAAPAAGLGRFALCLHAPSRPGEMARTSKRHHCNDHRTGELSSLLAISAERCPLCFSLVPLYWHNSRLPNLLWCTTGAWNGA